MDSEHDAEVGHQEADLFRESLKPYSVIWPSADVPLLETLLLDANVVLDLERFHNRPGGQGRG